MEKYQLQQLRDLPIERLGLQVVRHKALCPFHDDHHASLSFSVRRNTYRCFACGAHGGVIDLAMNLLHKDFREACRWLGDSPSALPVREGTVTPDKEESEFDASRYEKFFERPFLNDAARKFLFEERRLDERVVRWCRLTSWCDRRGVPWLQIPYYDREGKLVGVQNRNLVPGALPRFRFPQGSQCGIYNLPVLNLLRPGEDLWITEGASDCWAMLSTGRKAIAIPSATLLTKKDKELLLKGKALLPTGGNRKSGVSDWGACDGGMGRGAFFHMFPDRDLPGEQLFLQLQKVLPNLQHHQLPPSCKDFSDYYLQYLKPP